ncbi:MAG: EAL domain-containing protein [Methylobacter sp.]|uniref:cyclic-guanylate-specific phosphodiesterase n=1 Tax=Candidatus Methylobacter titanis TaxID=3053457 RepID=A0AA43Q2F8_9GAMM|nr:EAL domain-containing protein [Candidatus Methylobacter titanis]
MKLDIFTSLINLLIVYMVFAIAFAITARRHPNLDGPRHWLFACLALFTGYLGLGLRGVIPDILSIVVANSLTLTGGVFLWTGIRRFFGLRWHWSLFALFVLPGTVLLSLFMTVWPSIPARQIIMSVFSILISAFAIRDVLQQRSFALIMETNLFIGVVGTEIVMHFIRITTLMMVPVSTDSYLLGQNQPDKLFFIVLFMLSASRLLILVTLVSARLQNELNQLASLDPLTQLPNRRLLLQRLKHGINRERRSGKQMALLMLDLDRFKTVNDKLGHTAGDELLQQVAGRIQSRLREADTVARLGGDEFIVLLEDIAHPEDAARVAEEIVAALSRPFQLLRSNEADHEPGRDVQIGASIGISLYPQHADSAELLMEQADTAMYEAKQAGRGCYAYFSEELTIAVHKRINLEDRLRHAIEQQELRVFYQPQIDIASNRIIGAEALVRWQSPTEGLIAPIHFIPIAEETGLIIAIGEWVLRETCRQGQRWLADGFLPLTLAVNVSPQQFRRCDINALVAEVLAETGFPAGQLELEMTESGLMENQDNVVEVLNNLRNQGIRLAIDDFGTGYSSLAYLKRFPVDVLKIDKSFIDDIPHLQDDMEITATIIAMGHILGFKVLAEGVETQEQLDFLRNKGCDAYQGYFTSKPVPAADFTQLLQAQHEKMAAV